MARNSSSSHRKKADFFLTKANAFQAEGKLNKAIHLLRKGHKAYPSNLPLCLQLSAVEFSSGNTGAAVRVLEKALAKHPGQPDVLYHLGSAYLIAGEVKKAQSY